MEKSISHFLCPKIIQLDLTWCGNHGGSRWNYGMRRCRIIGYGLKWWWLWWDTSTLHRALGIMACTLGRIVRAFKGCPVRARYLIQSTSVASSALDKSCWDSCASVRGQAVPSIRRRKVKYRCSIRWAFAAAAIDLCWSASYAVFAADTLASSSSVMGRLLVFVLRMKMDTSAEKLQAELWDRGQGCRSLKCCGPVTSFLCSGIFLTLSSLSIVAFPWNLLFGFCMYYRRIREKVWSDLQALLVCSWKLPMFTLLQKCKYLHLVALSSKKIWFWVYRKCYLVTST